MNREAISFPTVNIGYIILQTLTTSLHVLLLHLLQALLTLRDAHVAHLVPGVPAWAAEAKEANNDEA